MATPTRGDTLLPMVRRLLGDHVAVIMISTLGDMGLIQRCLFSGEAAASSHFPLVKPLYSLYGATYSVQVQTSSWSSRCSCRASGSCGSSAWPRSACRAPTPARAYRAARRRHTCMVVHAPRPRPRPWPRRRRRRIAAPAAAAGEAAATAVAAMAAAARSGQQARPAGPSALRAAHGHLFAGAGCWQLAPSSCSVLATNRPTRSGGRRSCPVLRHA